MKTSSSPSLRAPSPPGDLFFGHARRFQRDPLNFLLNAARTCGPVTRLSVGPLTYHLVSEPALISEVLQQRAGNYLRDTRSSRNVRLVTGESLLTVEGDVWRHHRRLAQPAFHHHRIAEWAGIMAQAAAETAQSWEDVARRGATVDLASEMSRLTFTVVGRCLFGAELGAQSAQVKAALPVLLEELFLRTQQLANWPIWMPLPRQRQFRAALGVVHEVVERIIATRRNQAGERTDLLGLLLSARDDDGSALNDEELRNQVVTFLLAGHETTASTLTWAFALLAQHPDEQRAVEAELDGLTFEAITKERILEKLGSLTRLQAVLHETMRLYPAIWIAERRVAATDELGGFSLPGGSSVIVAPYVTHRLAAWWPEPERFRPERFLGGEPRSLSADGYFPFGAGPHACIGQHFAMMQAKIVLATLSARFRLRLSESPLPDALAGITLRPAAAVPVRVERRNR
jgi:cytochrome P450